MDGDLNGARRGRARLQQWRRKKGLFTYFEFESPVSEYTHIYISQIKIDVPADLMRNLIKYRGEVKEEERDKK